MMVFIRFSFFFFSSRRRHTRFDCDWSSDVCSSDLQRLDDRVVDPVLAYEVPRELDDLRVLGGNDARVPVANGRDRRLRDAELARLARLGTPDIDRVELARDRHRGHDAHAHVERALEADERAQMREAAGQLGGVQEHRERALERAAALDDALDDRVILLRHLSLARDGSQPCHGSPPDFQSRLVARSAPSRRARSFVHTTLSSTSCEPAKVPKPQSTPPSTPVRSPIASATATMRSATTSGCSTTFVVESTTPGTNSMPAGSGWRRNAFSSCWWRGLASGSESAPAFAR